MKIAVTGANSSVGQNLLKHCASAGDIDVVAGVRSERAFSSLPTSASITTRIITYTDPKDLAKALQGVNCVVHLAGILIESKQTNYNTANVKATEAVVQAAIKAGIEHLVFVSVVGADANSGNAYFRSKGSAEKLVAESGISATIIRTPILLGPGTAAANSLLALSNRSKVKVLAGGYYILRPLDIDDLNTAILKVCRGRSEGVSVHELVGPEAITYRDLVIKAADMQNNSVELSSVPVALAKVGAMLTSTFRGGGITPTVIDVITMNEYVESNADKALSIKLTPLLNTLEKIIDNKKT
ncbi:MAG: NAD(P)H-binding protein [Pseudomonadota bacterium]|nr:NAD(P)H-binding protein [Pseudomonadota bacterium]